VQETNCHPFRYRKWLFVHNGEIHNLERIRRDLLLAVAPELFPNIQGTTDSELMFYLALSFGLEADPLGALARMAGFIEETARKRGTAEPLWMTLGASNGKVIYAVRYSSAGEAPSLHYSRDVEDICELNPRLEGYFSPFSRIVVSEPMGSVVEAWVHVPEGSCLRVAGGDVDVRPFRPIRPDG
jgi:glutamine amidotransferase